MSLTDIRVESADIEVGLEDGAIVFFVGIDEVSATSSGRLALPGDPRPRRDARHSGQRECACGGRKGESPCTARGASA